MDWRSFRSAAALAVVLSLLAPSVLAQQRCDRKAVLASDTDVFETVPRYVTGVGWRGNIGAHLSSGTEVFVCRETTADFGFSTKTWVQIAYRSGSRWPVYGWVIKESLRLSSNANPNDAFATFFVGAAIAAAPPAAIPSGSQPSETPPELPPPMPSDGAGSASSSMTANVGDLWGLYWPLFLAMVLGMCAKVLVDLLDAWDKALLWAHLRNGIVAILVSPIVFLGLLSAGQFSGQTQTFLVLALLAFQNGFFWQTVLKRDGDRSTSTRSVAASKRAG